MRFEFATAGRIVFGAGSSRNLGAAACRLGQRALMVLGLPGEAGRAVFESLDAHGVVAIPFRVQGEPDVALIQEGVAVAKRENCDLVIAVGGGSAIDSGKAVSAMMTNGGALQDYLEVVGAGREIAREPAPFIAVPTTAGTGSEVTRNAVLAVPEQRVKVSMRSPMMLPRLAIVDPELTLDLPQAVTASTGLDALTQVIEPFVSLKANPLVDGFCREGMRRAARSLARACRNGADLGARTDMSIASLMGGLSLANAGLGVVHGFAGPIGGMFPAPHGAVCAALLPHGMRTNIRALQIRRGGNDSLQRYAEVAHILTGHEDARPEAGADWVEELCRTLSIPALAAYGITEADIPILAEKAALASSMKANPVQLSGEELAETLALACKS